MLAALMAVSGTGCAKSELTGMSEEEKNLYVQYSANLILRHDKNYIDRMTYVEAETEVQTSSNVAGTDSQNQAGMADSSAALTDMNSLFQINGLISSRRVRGDGFLSVCEQWVRNEYGRCEGIQTFSPEICRDEYRRNGCCS